MIYYFIYSILLIHHIINLQYWQNSCGQRLIISGTKSSLRPVTSGVPQSSIEDPLLFNISINNLDIEAECALRKFTDYTKLGGVADIPDDQAAIQRDPGRLEKWVDRNLIKFNKEKRKVLQLRRSNL